MLHATRLLAGLLLTATLGCGTIEDMEPDIPPTAEEIEAARAAWDDVYDVLTHPRCMNCHPAGDAPLQTDESTPHKWGVDRDAIANGLQCSSCHTATPVANAPAGSPPSAPHWGLPTADTPMIFEGRTRVELCAQFNDTEATGGRNPDDLLAHIQTEPLVVWAFDPGGDRTTPPLTHEAFIEAFTVWAKGDGACPTGD